MGEHTGNMANQLSCATHGALFYLGGEFIIEIFSNIFTISPDLIKRKLRKIISANAENRMNPAQIRCSFNDVVKQCIDANEYILNWEFFMELFNQYFNEYYFFLVSYVTNVASLLYWRNLVTLSFFCYSIGMSIYYQYVVNIRAFLHDFQFTFRFSC